MQQEATSQETFDFPGMKAPARNGLRYPIAPCGSQSDVRAGVAVSNAGK